uniref:Choline/carnitine acyltransferase domain-containing protein n=1 Tax=Acrobeloides nanus TaxID=290746 RepID=A0A914EDP9_9BILA
MLQRTLVFRTAVSNNSFVKVRLLSSFETDEYQFLHKSEIPTYHFQKSLRRLPIPGLEESCKRYLNAARVVLSENDYNETEKLVKDFLQTDGPKLQKELMAFDHSNKNTSYISEPWFDMYLRARVPCPVNYNPFMMFAQDPDPKQNEQLTRATNFAISCGRIKRALDAEVLAPEVFHLDPKKSDTAFFRRVCKNLPSRVSWFGAVLFKAFPLDMSQYTSLFGGNRIPKREKDILHHSKDAKHFIVSRNGHFYRVELFDQNGKLHPPNVIHSTLAAIIKDNRPPAASDECVGSLTASERDTWADIRTALEKDDTNRQSLRSIDDGLFIMCLDSLKTEDHQRLVQSLLCGDDGSNRWFDKCFQLIVDGNGLATINFEHSWGDGVAVLRLMEETLRDTSKNRFVTSSQQPDSTITASNFSRKLDWNLSPEIKHNITQAQKDHLNRCQDLQFATVEYTKLNRDSIKKHKVSPDSVMQLAIQLAFYRLYQGFVPTYESCSTAAFLKGRTECIRSATDATREAVLKAHKGEKLSMDVFKKCSDMHSQLVKEASMGKGFDRHILGLKITAQRLNLPLHGLFTSKAHEYMSHFVLSTSTLSTETIVFGGFGPVVSDGFGIGYNVVASKLGAVITSYKSQRDAAKMAESLNESLDFIKSSLESN